MHLPALPLPYFPNPQVSDLQAKLREAQEAAVAAETAASATISDLQGQLRGAEAAAAAERARAEGLDIQLAEVRWQLGEEQVVVADLRQQLQEAATASTATIDGLRAGADAERARAEKFRRELADVCKRQQVGDQRTAIADLGLKKKLAEEQRRTADLRAELDHAAVSESKAQQAVQAAYAKERVADGKLAEAARLVEEAQAKKAEATRLARAAQWKLDDAAAIESKAQAMNRAAEAKLCEANARQTEVARLEEEARRRHDQVTEDESRTKPAFIPSDVGESPPSH